LCYNGIIRWRDSLFEVEMPQLQQVKYQGIPALCYANETISLTILPEIGAKVISLRTCANGYEYLWHQPDRRIQPPEYDSVFIEHDISGWDECFPTIYPIAYPEFPWSGIDVPDHGEVWALPWRWELQGGSLVMATHSVRFAFDFQRTFTLVGNALVIGYQVTNESPFDLKALWSMHPFFRVTPQSRVLLPPESLVRIESSDDGYLGAYLSEQTWPIARTTSGNAIDLSLLGPPRKGTNSKLFSSKLQNGWAALYNPTEGHYAAFTFDPNEVPYVGICTLRGGWPPRGAEAFTLILEPCKGWPDRLDTAITRGDFFYYSPLWPVLLAGGLTPGQESGRTRTSYRLRAGY